MSLLAFCPDCPNPNDFTEIADMTCPIAWSEINRIIFQKVGAAPITKVNAALQATWLTLFGLPLNDPDKAVITPRNALMQLRPTPGEFIEAATNSDEVPTIIGLNHSTLAGMFTNLDAAAESQIRRLMCNVDLKMFFVTNNNQILGVDSGANIDGFVAYNGTLGLQTLSVGEGSGGIYVATFPFKVTFDDRVWSETRTYVSTTFAKSLIQP